MSDLLRPGPGYAIEMQAEAEGKWRPPEWIMLVPKMGTIIGRDGRATANPGAAAIIRVFRERAVDLCVDTDHALERMWSGRSTEANGWVVELREAGSAVEGRVEWTELGAKRLTSKEYRYHSPVYYVDRDRGSLIERVDSVSLTNKPNLYLPSLHEEEPMDESAIDKRLKALEDALGQQKQTSAQDDDAGVAGRLEALEKGISADRLRSVVSAGRAAGKITPAGEPEVLAMMDGASRERIDALEKWLSGAPPAIDPTTKLPAGEPQSEGPAASAERKQVREAMGKKESKTDKEPKA